MNPRVLTPALLIPVLCAPALGQSLGKTRKLGTPLIYRNLTLFPVYDSAAKSQNRYLTMDEGLKARSLTVKEKQGGGQVSAVLVTNRGRKPVYLMSGEVILGGQQDRIIGDDTIVPPQARNMPVRVYCVEHGRWSGKGEFERTARAAAVPSVRSTAQEGAFMAAVVDRAGIGAPSPLRAEAERSSGRAQQEVWDKVAAKNRAFKAAPDSGTYRDVLELKGGESGRSVKPYLADLDRKFPHNPKIVGAVAAVNGKVIASDVFGDPVLFRKLWPKLLRSYASEGAESANKTSRAIQAGEAARFVTDASRARSKTENRTTTLANERYDGRDARAYRLLDRAGGAAASPPVHESVIRK